MNTTNYYPIKHEYTFKSNYGNIVNFLKKEVEVIDYDVEIKNSCFIYFVVIVGCYSCKIDGILERLESEKGYYIEVSEIHTGTTRP